MVTRRVSFLGKSCQVCSETSLHCHQRFTVAPVTIISGVTSPFFSGCHKAATSGNLVAKQLSGDAAWLVQNRHPLPLVLLSIEASYTWSKLSLHCHQTSSPEPAVKSNGVKLPFLSLVPFFGQVWEKFC